MTNGDDTASNTGGVVDASILNPGEIDTGIPDFLKRDESGEPATAAPHGWGNVDTSTGNEQVQQVTHEASEVSAPTEALVSNAPSEVEKAAHSPGAGGDLEHDNSTNEPPASPEELHKEFMRDVNTFGRQSGTGAAALPRLGLRVLRAAADGLISTEKPKGGGKSDAVLIYEAYASQDSKHKDHSSGGMKANAAKLNAIIGMGVMTTIDPVAVGDRVVKIREKMEEAELKPKALFAGLVDVARAQQDCDTELTDEQITEALTKTTKEKTLQEEWEKVEKAVEKLISGENPQGLKDQTERALKIGELIHEHVKNYASEGADDELVKTLMTKGYTEAMAKEIVSKQG